MSQAVMSGALRSRTSFEARCETHRTTEGKRGAQTRIAFLRERLNRDGWMWTEKLRLWDRGQREHLSELVREELSSARKNRQNGASLSRLEQVLLALEYVETTDRSTHGYTHYRGGIWEVSSGGLPGLGKRA